MKNIAKLLVFGFATQALMAIAMTAVEAACGNIAAAAVWTADVIVTMVLAILAGGEL